MAATIEQFTCGACWGVFGDPQNPPLYGPHCDHIFHQTCIQRNTCLQVAGRDWTTCDVTRIEHQDQRDPQCPMRCAGDRWGGGDERIPSRLFAVAERVYAVASSLAPTIGQPVGDVAREALTAYLSGDTSALGNPNLQLAVTRLLERRTTPLQTATIERDPVNDPRLDSSIYPNVDRYDVIVDARRGYLARLAPASPSRPPAPARAPSRPPPPAAPSSPEVVNWTLWKCVESVAKSFFAWLQSLFSSIIA
ncbi:MAG: hypothetical protein SP1CHLAM54_17950 [Chlamydiia bacterium]|nr:hypothetical protein [Chlamydiia bacterium]MCH9616682.1 hypothetical protein [Chlamydiia bacterium]MCH9629413.1 hypothetical protein [Chlamydiia bacterium]